MNKRLNKIIMSSLSIIMLMIPTMNVNAESEAEVDYFDLADQIIEAETIYGLSGAQLVVIKDDEVVKSSSYGYVNNYQNVYDSSGDSILDKYELIPIEERTPVTEDTIFDLASNTKMYAANYAIQYLITRGELSLDDKVVDFFPEFKYVPYENAVDGQDKITIGHLLRHDSGFIASPKYHDNTVKTNVGQKEHGGKEADNWLYCQDANQILEKLLETPLDFEPGTNVRYSDVDFMLLGKIVELVSGLPLDEFVEKNIYSPIGITNVMFNPLDHNVTKNNIAATELHGNTRDGRVLFNNGRTEVLQGTVHDEKAWHSFAGVSGHAGLYGNALDVAKLANLMLTEGKMNGVELFSQDTIEMFSQPSALNDTYGYGWRRQGENKDYGWAFSNYASADTLGHTGWTGTITQIDPKENLVIVLFTNARNTPIMGPDKNDFYTKYFRTNDYGTITTLVYEQLGLGNDEGELSFLRNLIEEEIPNMNDTVSNRNELRSLLHVLKANAFTDENFLDYLLSDNIQSAIEQLNTTFDEDTVQLDTSMFTNIDKTELSNILNSISKFDPKDSYVQLAELMINDNTFMQEQVDSVTEKLMKSEDKILLDHVTKLIDERITDKQAYTAESFTSYDEAVEALSSYLNRNAYTYEELDSLYGEAVKALEALEKVITVEPPAESEDPDKLVESEDPDKPVESEKTFGEKESDESAEVDNSTLPKTGEDEVSIVPAIVLLSGTLVLTIILKKKQWTTK